MTMNHFKKHNSYGANIGSSSLIMIFVVLCLVCFSTLAIVSANADQKLSNKVMQRNDAYYHACNIAEEKLMQIDQSLLQAYHSSTSNDEYFDTVGHTISFAIPVGDLHTVSVELTVQYPTDHNQKLYRISKWELQTTGTLELDQSLPVIKLDD